MAEQSKERETLSDDADRRVSELAAFDREIEEHALQSHWKIDQQSQEGIGVWRENSIYW